MTRLPDEYKGIQSMSNVEHIGSPPWTRLDILRQLDEFECLYEQRPIKDNQGGMRAPHMFATWFMAKMLNPELIVESGVWKGQSTWLLEQACPDAKIVSLDLDLSLRDYVSDRAFYSDKDFAEQDWSDIGDRALAFFDDHQNAYKRLQQCKWFGFKHVIFEDNYPVTRGDCYSLKKAFAGAGFEPDASTSVPSTNSLGQKLARRLARLAGISPIGLTPQYDSVRVAPNGADGLILKKNLDIYYEFPPVVALPKTRWGDAWDDTYYPTPDPLVRPGDQDGRAVPRIFLDEASAYTWICYVRLK